MITTPIAGARFDGTMGLHRFPILTNPLCRSSKWATVASHRRNFDAEFREFRDSRRGGFLG